MFASLHVSPIKPARGSLTGRLLLPTGLLGLALLGVLLLAASLTAIAQTYNPNGVTVAGGNGQGSQANQLARPIGVAVDGSGAVYVADFSNHRIQKWAIGASQGVTVAGGNGQGQAPNQLNFPQGVAVDGSGAVYVADSDNHRIQKWAVGASQGVTVAGGNDRGSQANQLSFPYGVALDGSGAVYVADSDNHRIQKWAVGSSQGVTVAGGNGQGSQANQFKSPQGVAVDGSGAVYVADFSNHRIQKWAIGASQGVTVAGGNGAGQASNQLSFPFGVAVDGSGAVYVGDSSNDRIQKWAVGASQGVTVAGGNGQGSQANQLDLPFGVALDGSGAVYVADLSNHRIQKFSVCSLVSITAQPVAASSVCVGTPLSVPVSTSGTVTGYQWYRNGSLVSGQTSATLTLSNTTTAQSGSYAVVVTGGCNSVTSTAFNLTVTPQSPDYQALEALYMSTGGANWTRKANWVANCDVCSWQGVSCTNGRVTGLNLIGNNLSGTLPASLSALTNLQSLELGANALTGGIPTGIGNLTNLQTLNLSRTQLGGTIPASLGQLTRLQNLLLNESALTGSLPASLGTLTQLQNLQLYTNQLGGCFPGSYTALCGRSQVSFSGNPNLPGGGDFGAFCRDGTGGELVVSQYPRSATACVGSTFSFSVVARGAGSYQWYKDGQRLAETGPVLSFASVSASDAGTYQVYINYGCGNGAIQSEFFTLTVPAGGASLVSSGSLGCTDASVMLTAGGPSAGAGATYQFSNGATQVGNGPTATVNVAGTYSVTVASASGCLATASTTVVSNTAGPTVTISPSAPTVCAGTLTTLTAGGGDTGATLAYRWSTGATTASISVSATASTTYSVTATTSGGCSATASVSITVNPRPAAPYLTSVPRTLYTTNFPIPLVIYALPTNFGLDLRFYQAATNARVDPPVIRPTQPGTFDYYATQTDSKGCVSVPAAFSLKVLEGGTLVSKPADRSVCAGSSTVLSVTATGGNLKYSWYEAHPDTPLRVSEVGNDTKGGKTANLTVNNVRQTKLYYCLVIGDKGIGVAGPIRVSLQTNCGSGARVAAGEPGESLQVRVLGNPVTGQELSVAVEGAEGQPLRLTVTNLQGRPVSERHVEQAGATERHTLSLGNQPPGILLLRVSAPTQSQTVKVLKAE